MHEESDARWMVSIEKKLDKVSDQIDDMQQSTADLWQRYQAELEKIRDEMRDKHQHHGEKLSAHTTELTTWRWALLICLGMILTAVMNVVISRYPLEASALQTPPRIDPYGSMKK